MLPYEVCTALNQVATKSLSTIMHRPSPYGYRANPRDHVSSDHVWEGLTIGVFPTLPSGLEFEPENVVMFCGVIALQTPSRWFMI